MKVERDFTVIENCITGERKILAFGDGVFHEIGIVEPTKWAAVSRMFPALVDACEKSVDWHSAKSCCQSLINAGPSVHPADVSAQVFDPLKLMRSDSRLGALL